MCYIEGAWRTLTDKEIHPSFDRNNADENMWYQLQQNLFSTYTGRKNLGENLPVLPTKLYGVENGTFRPVLAQWNYRMLCHPLKQYVKPSTLNPVDDLASRFRTKETSSAFLNEPTARFRVYDNEKEDETYEEYGLIDKLMGEIPGLDNYPGNVVDDSFGEQALDFNNGSVLNAGRYHRYYKVN